MNSSRPRISIEGTRKSRHAPRTQQDNLSRTQPIHAASGLTQSSYALPSGSPDFYTEIPTWTDSFYSGTDSHMPVFSVDPNDLTRPSYWDPLHTKYDGDLSSVSSAASAKSCISPPMVEAEMMHVDMYQLPEDRFDYFPDPWLCRTMPITPPAEPSTDIFGNIKTDPMDFSLPEPATECEYIGVSQLQFASVPSRHSQPRPIRSASERNPISPSSGSSYSPLTKDDHSDRVKHNPRNDPRYEEKADKDGYYHCPYVTEGCNHKPTKQKCIYAKNLDSHLKPYVCRHGATDESCRSLRFSSNACLFRHEREMHGLHNHGINPYLCMYPGCERARRDNGFPRRWNQRDHMKRVHGWDEVDSDESADRGYPVPSTRRKKSSSTQHHIPMKRTSSSRAQASYYPETSRTGSAPRHLTQTSRGLQARHNLIPCMKPKDVSYAPQHMVNQSYGYYPAY